MKSLVLQAGMIGSYFAATPAFVYIGDVTILFYNVLYERTNAGKHNLHTHLENFSKSRQTLNEGPEDPREKAWFEPLELADKPFDIS